MKYSKLAMSMSSASIYVGYNMTCRKSICEKTPEQDIRKYYDSTSGCFYWYDEVGKVSRWEKSYNPPGIKIQICDLISS